MYLIYMCYPGTGSSYLWMRTRSEEYAQEVAARAAAWLDGWRVRVEYLPQHPGPEMYPAGWHPRQVPA